MTNDVEHDGSDFVIPGARWEHVIRVMTDARIDLAVKILQAAEAADARLESLTSSRYGERMDYRLRLSGIGTARARSLSEHISGFLGDGSSSIDHHILTCPLETPSC